MYTVEFNYARHRIRYVPIIPISLRSKDGWIEVWAYVDSGAFYMEVGFSPKLGVGFNLLGMDLFDRYKVTFDNKAKKVIFEKG